jgi:O-antigen ligase
MAFLTLCLVLGGASGRGAGAAANGLLQVVAICLIVFSLWTRRNSPIPAQARPLCWIVGLFALYVLATLLPLPPSLWVELPGRGPIRHGFELLEIPRPWLPVSLACQNSLTSLLWLLPPLAIFLLVMDSSSRDRRLLLWVPVGIAVVSIGLGGAQLLDGPDSPLRFYEITNPTSAVGFFANANHFATFLLCTLPLAGYLAGRATRHENAQGRISGIILSVSIVIFALFGVGIIGSLAGYGLAVPTVFAAALIYRRAAHGPLTKRWITGGAVLFAAFLGLAFLGPLNQEALSDKYDNQSSSRATLGATTWAAVTKTIPTGTGLGTFVDVYRTFEERDPRSREYANHAHNDYLEILLELGIPGALLVLGFLWWWVIQLIRAWKSDLAGAGLGRAGSVIIGVILLHSLVDYPLRTTAIAAIFSFGCALLMPFPRLPAQSNNGAEQSGRERLRHMEAV